MVNKNNNKNTNIINIVNDLKGLGLLKRKRRRQSTEQTGKVIINPNRQLTGIERTIIDNSPMLRRDVQQIANERSVLEDRVKQNDAHLNNLYNELDSGRIFNRFMQENNNIGSPSGSLANVKTNSLVLPSMSQQYNEEQKLNNDSIDVPVIDATKSMIAQKDEPEKETVPEAVKEISVDEVGVKPEDVSKELSKSSQSSLALLTPSPISPSASSGVISPKEFKETYLSEASSNFFTPQSQKSADSSTSAFIEQLSKQVDDTPNLVPASKPSELDKFLEYGELYPENPDDQSVPYTENDIKIAKQRSTAQKTYEDIKVLKDIYEGLSDEKLNFRDAKDQGVEGLTAQIFDWFEENSSTSTDGYTPGQLARFKLLENYLLNNPKYKKLNKVRLEFNELYPKNQLHLFEAKAYGEGLLQSKINKMKNTKI